MCDELIDILLTPDNLDDYYIKQTIFKSLCDNLFQFHGKLLDVGCGKMLYREYILQHSSVQVYTGLDLESALVYDDKVKPDYIWDGISMPFEDEVYDCAIATEVLEHCHDPNVTLSEIFRVLKPGGIFFFTIPFLWNLHEVPYDEYRYTPFAINRHLRQSGYRQIHIKATGGWHAAMAQMIGLWVKRGPISSKKKRILSRALLPIVRYLIVKDKKPSEFKEGQMITGLAGIAIK